ncbi:MAG TPA: hydrogenase maturation protease [Verrucomicrobiae bacterium]|nr:hydrogenase maturation protease [Verrucomicrobiae bacterium]
MPRVLIVAYGNPLRADDGVACRAADQLLQSLPDSEIQCFHQLGPELAEAITHFERVIFLDAAFPTEGMKPGDIRIQPLLPNTNATDQSRFSHVVTPQTVVTLASSLYHVDVKADLITVTGQTFDHGDRLSDAVAAALPNLVAKVEQLARTPITNS